MSGNCYAAGDRIRFEEYRARYMQLRETAREGEVPGTFALVDREGLVVAAFDDASECLSAYHAMVLANPRTVALRRVTVTDPDPPAWDPVAGSAVQRAMALCAHLTTYGHGRDAPPELSPYAGRFLVCAVEAGEMLIAGATFRVVELSWPDEQGDWVEIGLLLTPGEGWQLLIADEVVPASRSFLDRAIAEAVSYTVLGATVDADIVSRQTQTPFRTTNDDSLVTYCVWIADDLATRLNPYGPAAPYRYESAAQAEGSDATAPGLPAPESAGGEPITVKDLQRTLRQQQGAQAQPLWAVLDGESVVAAFSRSEEAIEHLNVLIDEDPSWARCRLCCVADRCVNEDRRTGPPVTRVRLLFEMFTGAEQHEQRTASEIALTIEQSHRALLLRVETGEWVHEPSAEKSFAARFWWYSDDGQRRHVGLVTQVDGELPKAYVDSRALGLPEGAAAEIVGEVLNQYGIPMPDGGLWTAADHVLSVDDHAAHITVGFAHLCLHMVHELGSVQP